MSASLLARVGRSGHVVAACSAMLLSGCAGDPERDRRFLVSPAWVAEHLGDPDLVLLHVGDEERYAEEHLPGARRIDLEDISTPRGAGLTLQLPDVSQLEAAFASRGVTDRSRVVVYWGEDEMTPTARVFLTLEYLGMGTRSSILDGGLPAWRAEGLAVTAEVPGPASGSFTPRVREDVVVDLAWLVAHKDDAGVAVVDARTPDFYAGDRQGRYPRAGHIPGAGNVPYPTLVDSATMRFKDPDVLRAMFEDAGVDDGDRIVTYCHIGQQASLLYVAARHAGYDARMFDGSFEEWSNAVELPVAPGGGGDRPAR